MSASHDPSLCYHAEVDDGLRTYYVDLGGVEFTTPDAETILDDLVEEDWPRKLTMLKGLFKKPWNAPDIGSVYDVRYEGRPNARHLYDILFLPGFTKPAYKLSLSVLGDHVRKLDWHVYTAREFSAIHPGLYGHRFQILKSDLPACRLSGIEILKDRLTPAGFEAWLRSARFHDDNPKF